MKLFYKLLALTLCCLASACIPLKIAPNIEGDKVYKPKRFKRQLPKQYVYVFNDPKDANEFYNYVNAKFQVQYDDETGNGPIKIDGTTYYLTFFEVERSTETVNLVPIVIDEALENNGYYPILEDAHVTRTGKWFIALTVSDEPMKDALKPSYKNHAAVLAYLNGLREEYLSTAHYIELYFKASTAN